MAYRFLHSGGPGSPGLFYFKFHINNKQIFTLTNIQNNNLNKEII